MTIQFITSVIEVLFFGPFIFLFSRITLIVLAGTSWEKSEDGILKFESNHHLDANNSIFINCNVFLWRSALSKCSFLPLIYHHHGHLII